MKLGVAQEDVVIGGSCQLWHPIERNNPVQLGERHLDMGSAAGQQAMKSSLPLLFCPKSFGIRLSCFFCDSYAELGWRSRCRPEFLPDLTRWRKRSGPVSLRGLICRFCTCPH